MGVFEALGTEFEQVVFFHDPPSGLRAIVAVHSTALGPALGGTRFYPYPSEEVWKDSSLSGRRVAVQGVGKVGYHLAKLLHEAGASLVVSDVDVDAVARAVREFDVDTAEPDKIHAEECDIFAPCALGGVIRDDTIPSLKCRVVAGAANNQLAAPEHGEQLAELGILYAPDYIINAGGIINVADELRGYDRDRAMRKVEGIYRTLRQVFSMARERGISTARAADRFAVERVKRLSRLRQIWVPGR